MAETDPDALERKIERTRAELARTVDAIADRVSPKRMAQRGVAKVKEDAEHFVAAVGDLVGGAAQRSGITPPPSGFAEEAEAWPEERPPAVAPILIGVGAVLVVGTALYLLRRRRRS